MRSTTPPVYASISFRLRRTKCVLRFAPRKLWLEEIRMTDVFPPDTIRCDACPVLCYIKRGQTGACDRYGNFEGQLVRVDPHILLDRAKSQGTPLVPFLEREGDWDGKIMKGQETFVTALGAGQAYPEYKPAPFIVSS